MKQIGNRLLERLTPGVRVLACLLVAVSLAAVIGKLSRAYDLYHCLVLSSPNFWNGQVWRLVTYPLLPVGVLDFVMNGLIIIMLGGLLERVWTRGEFWSYCAIPVVGTGLAKVILSFSSPAPLVGAGPLVFGLLAAWGCLLGHEQVPLGTFATMTVRQLALLAGAISMGVTVFTAGLVNAFLMLAGVLAGLLYLWLRAKLLMSRESRMVESGRINRLEL
jgi:membrane associated rhomboid family serine protease